MRVQLRDGKTNMIAAAIKKPCHLYLCLCLCLFLQFAPLFLYYFYISVCASKSHLCGIHSARMPRGSDRKRHLPATDTRLGHRGTRIEVTRKKMTHSHTNLDTLVQCALIYCFLGFQYCLVMPLLEIIYF